MSEETADVSEDTTFDPIGTQDEFDKRVSARIARERAKFADYADLKTKAAQLDEIQESAKTETQKALDRIRSLETELETERFNTLRQQVAAAKSVPPHRISGNTQEELETSAEEYLAEVAQLSKQQRTKSATYKSGATASDNRLDPKDRSAAAVRALQGG